MTKNTRVLVVMVPGTGHYTKMAKSTSNQSSSNTQRTIVSNFNCTAANHTLILIHSYSATIHIARAQHLIEIIIVQEVCQALPTPQTHNNSPAHIII